MAKRRKSEEAGRAARAERCVFCRLSEKLSRSRDAHSSVIEHLDNAKREILQAVREFVDHELDFLERALQKRKGKRVTRIRVEE